MNVYERKHYENNFFYYLIITYDKRVTSFIPSFHFFGLLK